VSIDRQALRETVSRGLRLRVRGTVANKVVGPPVTIDVSAVGGLISQSGAPISAYVWRASGTPDFSDIARITDYTAADGELTLSRDLNPVLSNGDTVDVFSILSPEDWNLVCDDAMENLGRNIRITVAPSSGVAEYDLTTTNTWLTRRNQVESVLVRRTDGTNLLYEEPYSAYTLLENDNALTLQLHTVPSDLTNLSIIVLAKRYYATFATDAATTSCPDVLARAAVRVEALRMIYVLMGEENAKGLFATELAESLDALEDAKREFLPRVKPIPIHFPVPYEGPDLAMQVEDWRW
jgi:hypothetical protein